MQITCPGCGKQLPINDQLRGMKIPCDGCHTPVYVPLAGAAANRWEGSAVPPTPKPLPTFSSASQPLDPPFPAQANKYSNDSVSNDSVSNHSIIITAASCLFGLILVVGTTMMLSSLTKVPPNPTVEAVPEESGSRMDRTDFQEGYSMVLPPGFKQESREETERGYIVYRFRSEEGYKFTLAIIPDESVDRFTNLPRDYSEALVQSVRELSEGIDAEVQPVRVTAGGMPATLFRYYEKETYRGVTFTYFMVVMDRGRKLVLKIAGKYGDYYEQDQYITSPDHWYDSLLTLRKEPNET